MSSVPLFFSFHHLARFSLTARAVSALMMSSVMSSVPAGLLAYRSAMSPVVLASPFPGSPLIVSSPRPALRVGGRGAGGAACLPHDVVACGGCVSIGHDLDVERLRCLSPCLCHPPPPVLLLRIGWRWGLERLRCDTTGGGCLSNEGMATGVLYGFL